MICPGLKTAAEQQQSSRTGHQMQRDVKGRSVCFSFAFVSVSPQQPIAALTGVNKFSCNSSTKGPVVVHNVNSQRLPSAAAERGRLSTSCHKERLRKQRQECHQTGQSAATATFPFALTSPHSLPLHLLHLSTNRC